METQEIVLAVIFAAALLYVGRMIYNNLRADKGCNSGCGKCGVNFSEIEPKKSPNSPGF